MSDPTELSKDERALIAWCRSARDWPIPGFAWGNLRGIFYAAAIYVALLVTAVVAGWLPFSGDEAVAKVVWWVVVPGVCWFFVGWLANRFQRMAALIDKLGRWAEAEEARRLASVDHR